MCWCFHIKTLSLSLDLCWCKKKINSLHSSCVLVVCSRCELSEKMITSNFFFLIKMGLLISSLVFFFSRLCTGFMNWNTFTKKSTFPLLLNAQALGTQVCVLYLIFDHQLALLAVLNHHFSHFYFRRRHLAHEYENSQFIAQHSRLVQASNSRMAQELTAISLLSERHFTSRSSENL